MTVPAKLFGPTGKREPIGGGKGETPVSLRPEVRIEQAEDGLKMSGHVAIQLKEDHEGDLPVAVNLQLSSVDEGHRHLDPIAITATFANGIAHHVAENEWHLTLSPGEKVDVAVESISYETDWTVEFVPRVRPLNTEVSQ